MSAMCSGSQAQDEKPGTRVAERWHRLTPISPIAIGAPLYFRHFRAILQQPGTSLAVNDFGV